MAVVADPERLSDALLSGTADEAGIELSAEAPLLAEAQEVFPETVVAKDGLTVDVPYR